MKIRNMILNLPIYFLYMFGSCVIVMLAEALLVSILEKIVALPYPVLTVIRILIYSVGVTALLAVLGYFEGYRESVCSVWDTVCSGVLAMVPHLIFAMLFKFHGFVSGAVRFTAGILHNGWDITYDSLINETPYATFLLTFVLYGAIYVTAITVAKYFGAQKRIIDRSDLRKGEPRDES